MKTRIVILSLVLSVYFKSQCQTQLILEGSYKDISFIDLVSDLETRYELKFYFSPELNSAKMNLEFKDISLEEVLSMLTQFSGINFLLKDDKTIIATGQHLVQTKLDPVLFNLTPENGGASFVSEQRYIQEEIQEIIELDKNDPLETQLNEIGESTNRFNGTSATVAGYVRDVKTGEPIFGASVFKKDPLVGAVTDQFGYFSLTIPKGKP